MTLTPVCLVTLKEERVMVEDPVVTPTLATVGLLGVVPSITRLAAL